MKKPSATRRHQVDAQKLQQGARRSTVTYEFYNVGNLAHLTGLDRSPTYNRVFRTLADFELKLRGR